MPVRFYREDLCGIWDSFVLRNSINGNFLQTRAFLGYHPEDRFCDCSVMYYDEKNNLRAVIPAACMQTEGRKVFASHPGSTYGGIVLDGKSCSAKRVQAIIDETIEYLNCAGFDGIELKFPPDFLWRRNAGPLIEYMMQLNGFTETLELTTYIDYVSYGNDIVSNFSQGKRTNVNNGKKAGLKFAILTERSQFQGFYKLLCENLKKHETAPVHSFDELLELHTERLAGSVELVGIFEREKMVAGGWLFLFRNQLAAHTQYLCADPAYDRLSPMTFLYYSLIEYCRGRGYRYLSWGASTEDAGRILNWGLTASKESFGSSYDVIRRYFKHINHAR